MNISSAFNTFNWMAQNPADSKSMLAKVMAC